MNTISLSAGNIIISLDDTEIDIGGTVCKNLVVIARLLNIDEINRIVRIDKDSVDEYIADDIYEDVFKNCVLSIPGIDGLLDLGNSSAGFIPSIGAAILNKSMEYAEDPIASFKKSIENVDVLDSMCAVISRYLSTPYYEVRSYSINKIFDLFAICHKTFPNEVQELQKEENTINSDIPKGN